MPLWPRRGCQSSGSTISGTPASRILGAQEVPAKVIAEILGHSDIRLTQNVYQHVYKEAKLDAAAKMDKLLAGEPAKGVVATNVATKMPPVNRISLQTTDSLEPPAGIEPATC